MLQAPGGTEPVSRECWERGECAAPRRPRVLSMNEVTMTPSSLSPQRALQRLTRTVSRRAAPIGQDLSHLSGAPTWTPERLFPLPETLRCLFFTWPASELFPQTSPAWSTALGLYNPSNDNPFTPWHLSQYCKRPGFLPQYRKHRGSERQKGCGKDQSRTSPGFQKRGDAGTGKPAETATSCAAVGNST